MKPALTLLAISLVASSAPQLRADENLWIYTRGVETRPQGSWELKLTDVMRVGKNSGDYMFNDFQPELEYGVTDRFTLGATLLIFDHNYSNVEWAPMVDTQGGPGGSYDRTQIGGFRTFGKYMVLSPVVDPIGFGFAIAYDRRRAYRLDGAKIDQDTIIPSLFLQKNWLDDTLTLAFTGRTEFESRVSPGVLEEEIAFDLGLGLAYRFAPRWTIGLETRWQTDFIVPEIDGVVDGRASNWDWNQFALGDQFQYGLYVGPSIHYAAEKWWTTFGAVAQVNGWSADGAAASNQGRNWDEHERWHIGFIVGFEFGQGGDVASEDVILAK